jgi:hypothetical protein
MDKREYKYIGKSPDRSEGLEKVTGRAVYVHDMELPGMLYAKALHSPFARAKIISIDTSADGALNPNMLNMQQVSKYTKTIKYQGEMYESFSPKASTAKLSNISTTDSITFWAPVGISLKLFSLSRAITASMIRKAIIIHVLKIVSVIQTSTPATFKTQRLSIFKFINLHRLYILFC